jgi:hypothetical protein
MRWIGTALRELIALFVDDGSFAAALLAWLAGAVICLRFFDVPPAAEGIILALGFACLLAENVERTARGSRKRAR